MLNLDTHIVLHALAGDLSTAEDRLLRSHKWGISAIVLWEIAKLVQHGRVSADLDDPDFVRQLATIHVWPIDFAVARVSTHLDFRSDPADELIAATSVVHGVPLVTRDRKIRESKIVPLADWSS